MTSNSIINGKEKNKEYKRGEVYLVRFDKIKQKEKNTEIKEPHPAVIISNEWINNKSKRVIVVPFTSTIKPFYESWEVYSNFGNKKGKIMCDQIRSIDKKDRIRKKLGTLDPKTFQEVEEKVLEVLELTKSLSNKQLLNELARRIKDKEIDWESILTSIEEK